MQPANLPSQVNSTEQWKAIPGYEGYYEVSDCGRVRSVLRSVPDKRRGLRTVKGVLLRHTKDRRGYWQVSLTKLGKGKTFRVHVLVLTAFIGPRPHRMDGCHNDGNVDNNSVANLRWDTRKANCRDMRVHGTLPCGELNHSAKLTTHQVKEIIRLYDGPNSQRPRRGPGRWAHHWTKQKLANYFGVSRGAIDGVLRGNNWKHLSGATAK